LRRADQIAFINAVSPSKTDHWQLAEVAHGQNGWYSDLTGARVNPSTVLILGIITAFFLSSCDTRPITFKAAEPGWSSVSVQENMTKDAVWNSISDLLAKSYDLEIISKESGYIRTGFKFQVEMKGSSPQKNEYYKSRIIIKIAADNSKVELKTDAAWYDKGRRVWIEGYDDKVQQTLKTDIGALVGGIAK
jgi:hypothetical protein